MSTSANPKGGLRSCPRAKRGESSPRVTPRLTQLNPYPLWRDLERMFFFPGKIRSCPPRWSLGYKVSPGACYPFPSPHPLWRSEKTLVEQPMSWEEARDRCIEEGGHLAEVNTPKEQDFLAWRVSPPCPHSLLLVFSLSKSWGRWTKRNRRSLDCGLA